MEDQFSPTRLKCKEINYNEDIFIYAAGAATEKPPGIRRNKAT
ncbi:hypothetical protein [Trichlorobacter lovleyi]|nr:hypothetical protein [Trichlorobacter lovleyi]